MYILKKENSNYDDFQAMRRLIIESSPFALLNDVFDPINQLGGNSYFWIDSEKLDSINLLFAFDSWIIMFEDGDEITVANNRALYKAGIDFPSDIKATEPGELRWVANETTGDLPMPEGKPFVKENIDHNIRRNFSDQELRETDKFQKFMANEFPIIQRDMRKEHGKVNLTVIFEKEE